MRKLNRKFAKIGIISSIICSFVFYSCENAEDKTEKSVSFNSELRKESLSKGNGLVSESVALDIATKFNPLVFFKQDNPTNYSKKISKLDGNNRIKDKTIIKDSNDIPAFYIFNYENNQGFIFVSADYKMQPILAFFESGEFKKDIVPSGLLQWVDKTMENIEILRKGGYDNSNDADYAWDNYYSHNSNKIAPPPPNPCDTPDTSYTVGPLLSVTWGQGYSYNELCPNLSCTNGNSFAYTGCVATAATQVVKYWHPTNQYNYNYASMPTNQGNSEVRRLMRDMGNNVGMSYGCSGSSANGSNVAPVLKANFGFSSANNANYDYQRVENNVNAQQPVLLTGCRTATGNWFIINWGNSYSDCHQWVCDGSNTYNYTICENGQWQGGGSYLFFHMNWGWHEYNTPNDYSGWFLFNNWNINSLNQNYQYSNKLTSEIHP